MLEREVRNCACPYGQTISSEKPHKGPNYTVSGTQDNPPPPRQLYRALICEKVDPIIHNPN